MPRLSWTQEPDDLLLPLRLALRSAYEILTGYSASRIKSCPACTWLFLDASKNNPRRWCDMQDCGNRIKARRHYQRRRAASVERGA